MSADNLGPAPHEALDQQDTIAPASSGIFQEVLRAAERDGVDREALCRLFWLLNAHPRLLGHQRCLQNLLSLLSTPEFHNGVDAWADDWAGDTPAWIDAARWAGRLQSTGSSALEDFVKEPRHASHHVLMRHGINRHPVAGAVWIRHHSDPDPMRPTHGLTRAGRTFRLLQWHFFCSQAQARHEHCTLAAYMEYDKPDEWPAWPRPAAALGLAIRKFSYPPFDALLESLPYETRLDRFSLEVVAAKDRLIKQHSDEPARQRVIALTSYFEDFKNYFEGRPLRPRRHGGGGSGGARRTVPGFIHLNTEPLILFEPPEADSGDEDVPTRTVTRVSVRDDTLDRLTAADREAMDLAPGEDMRPVLELFPIEDFPGGIHRLWAIRQAIDAVSQRIYWDKSQLTPLEVAALLDAITSAETENAEHASVSKEAGLLLKCMLMFGCTAEGARTTRTMWTSTLASMVERHEPLTTRAVLVDAETGECAGIAVPAVVPAYVSEPPEGFRRCADAAQSYLLLPDTAGLGAALLEHQRGKDVEIGGALFSESPIRLEDRVEQILLETNQWLDAASRPRLTTVKVSRKLPALLARAGLDEVGVALVCGDHGYKGQARLHYTQHQTQQLARAYAKAIQRMASEARRPLKSPSSSDCTASPGSIGARLIVTTDALRQLIASLRSELARTPERGRSAWHRYHRAYILYTAVMQGLLTGIRPTLQPETLLNQFLACDKPMGREPIVVCVSEKDDQYEARSRPMLITGRLQRQFVHLAAHEQEMWRWQPAGLLTSNLTRAQRAYSDWDDHNLKPTARPVSPSWIARELARHGLYAAANFTRAYLRTWLLKDGCSQQAIDGLLGHAGTGQSPVHMHSTFAFELHINELSSRLERMSSALGLESVPSRLAKP